MVGQPAHQLIANWDRVAIDYEEFATPFSQQVAQLVIDAVEPVPGEHFMDVGAGTGAMTRQAFGWPDAVIAVDLAPQLVDYSRRKLIRDSTEQLVEWNVAFHVMDGHALRFPHNWFQSAGSNLGLIYFEDPIEALRQMLLVLKPLGRVAISSITNRGQATLISPVLEAIVTVDPTFRPSAVIPSVQLSSPTEMRQAFLAAGFENITIETTVVPHPIRNLRTYWDRWALDAPAVTDIFRDLGPETRAAAGDAFVEAMEPHRRDGIVALPVEVLIGRAEKLDDPNKPRGFAAMEIRGHPPVDGVVDPDHPGLRRMSHPLPDLDL